VSTYCYFRCIQHDPPLVSKDEFTQHVDDYHYKQGLEMAKAMRMDPIPWMADGIVGSYFAGNAYRFLTEHVGCPIDIYTETGIIYPVPGREKISLAAPSPVPGDAAPEPDMGFTEEDRLAGVSALVMSLLRQERQRTARAALLRVRQETAALDDGTLDEIATEFHASLA
jgi:hypothetical protein